MTQVRNSQAPIFDSPQFLGLVKRYPVLTYGFTAALWLLVAAAAVANGGRLSQVEAPDLVNQQAA